MRMCAGKQTQRLKMEEEISSSATPSPERRLRPRQQRRVEMSDTSSTSSPIRRGAVRGRGRGRPAGRRGARGGRGGGRGQRGGHIGDVAAAALQDRQRNLRARIEEMSDTSRKELLMKTGDKHPSLLLDLIDQEAPQGGFHPVPGGESPSWCSCLMCRDMPTQIERICCGRPPNQCQSQLPDFQLLILDELVLTIAQMYRQDVLALPQDEDYNKGKRYAAYRQFILWHHGRLGVGVRRIIPSCCTWAIRDKYPNQYGQYIGFIPSRLG